MVSVASGSGSPRARSRTARSRGGRAGRQTTPRPRRARLAERHDESVLTGRRWCRRRRANRYSVPRASVTTTGCVEAAPAGDLGQLGRFDDLDAGSLSNSSRSSVRMSTSTSNRICVGSPGSRDRLDDGACLRPAAPSAAERFARDSRHGRRRRPRPPTASRASSSTPPDVDPSRTDSRSTGRRSITPGISARARSSAQRGRGASTRARLEAGRRRRPGNVAWSRCETDHVHGVRDREDAERHGQHQEQRRPRVAQRPPRELSCPERRHQGPRRHGGALDELRRAGERSGAPRSRRPAARWPVSRPAAGRGPGFPARTGSAGRRSGGTARGRCPAIARSATSRPSRWPMLAVSPAAELAVRGRTATGPCGARAGSARGGTPGPAAPAAM